MSDKNKEFRQLLKDNVTITRRLYDVDNDGREFFYEDQFRKIAIFESDLTRCFGHSRFRF